MQSKTITVSISEAKEIIEMYCNRHVGRILYKSGDSCSPIIKDLIKKELWHFANNIKKDIFGLEPSLPPKVLLQDELVPDYLKGNSPKSK